MSSFGSGKKALVIEDDGEGAELAGFALGAAGFAVLTAANGAEGLRLARLELPDLIVLDLFMPGMLGFDVLKALRQDPLLSGVKVIVTTGKSYATDMRVIQGLGIESLLVKPFSGEDLLERVRTALTA